MDIKLEEKISRQVNLQKNGVYEVFVNASELRKYWELSAPANENIYLIQKVFIPVFDQEILGISFERSRALQNMLSAAEFKKIN